MKTTQTTATTAIYEPDRRRIMFAQNGKPSHGFVGEMASKKFLEACATGIPVSIHVTNENIGKTRLIKQFHAILAKKGMLNIKEDILASYNVASSKELTLEQLEQVIHQLNGSATPEVMRKERSTVLSLLDKLGIKGNSEIGWDRVNAYLLQPRIAGKILYHMDATELRACSLRLRAIIGKQLTINN